MKLYNYKIKKLLSETLFFTLFYCKQGMALLRGNSVNAAVLQFPVFETWSNEVLSKNKLFHEKFSHKK